MKQHLLGILLAVVACFASLPSVIAQTPELQIYKGGSLIQSIPINNIDSIKVYCPLNAPSNVTAELSNESIVVTWTAVNGAQFYQLYRSGDANNYVLLADNLTTTSYTDNKPIKGTNYYKVKAIGEGKESAMSESTGTVTLPGNEYVDLGLPSGTLWATMNVGANYPEDFGDYFSWGETTGYNSGKTVYDWNTYKLCNGTKNTLTKYNSYKATGPTVDHKTELEPEDDAATANWGGDWQMPSLPQIRELINTDYTTTIWTTQNGVNGYKITSKSNGNSIFLPAAGRYVKWSYDNSGYGQGEYWSRSIGTSEVHSAYTIFHNYTGIKAGGNRERCNGLSVRAVRVQQ